MSRLFTMHLFARTTDFLAKLAKLTPRKNIENNLEIVILPSKGVLKSNIIIIIIADSVDRMIMFPSSEMVSRTAVLVVVVY